MIKIDISRDDVKNVLSERLKSLSKEKAFQDEEVKVILDALDYYAPVHTSEADESYITFIDRYLHEIK